MDFNKELSEHLKEIILLNMVINTLADFAEKHFSVICTKGKKYSTCRHKECLKKTAFKVVERHIKNRNKK